MERSQAVQATKEMLLSWFRDEELEICPHCHQREVLPAWGPTTGRICLTCGMLSRREELEAVVNVIGHERAEGLVTVVLKDHSHLVVRKSGRAGEIADELDLRRRSNGTG